MHASGLLPEIVILLAASVCVVALLRRLRISPVLGYLAAGAAIGPFALQLSDGSDATSELAEFGIIFLLFLIGLELSFERLKRMRRHVFGFGGAQFALSSLLFIGICLFLGSSAPAAVVIGCGLSLSSTAIVLQVIAEQGEKSSQVGRLSLAVLVLQDLAAVPLLILIPLLEHEGPHDGTLAAYLATAALKAAIGLAVMFAIGRWLLRPLFRFIAALDSTELFSATALLVVLGSSWLASLAGLPIALGAFISGLLMAETEFKPQVESELLPFKDLFLGLFFMTIGMSLNLPMLLSDFAVILGLMVIVITSKALIILLLCRLFGFNMGTAIHTGLLLAQGGEFTFVLFTLAGDAGIIREPVVEILLVVVTLSMALTPLLAQLGKRMARKLEKFSISSPETLGEETLDLRRHVIISGFGRVGHTVARLLESEQQRFVAIDRDALLVARERKAGLPVYYGDTARAHVLGALGIQRATAVIITHSDTRVALQTIAAIRDINHTVPIIARAKNIEQVQRLEAAGANLAVAEMFETSLQLGGALLQALGIAEMEITRIIALFRAGDYALTRTAEQETLTAG